MQFQEAIQSGFRNYANFSGRASRSEFWYWTLFDFLLGIAAMILDAVISSWTGFGVFNLIVSLGLLLPCLAVSVRRLHDIDRTGWWLLLIFTLIGIIVLIVWNCIKGTTGANRFGPDPLAGQA